MVQNRISCGNYLGSKRSGYRNPSHGKNGFCIGGNGRFSGIHIIFKQVSRSFRQQNGKSNRFRINDRKRSRRLSRLHQPRNLYSKNNIM